MTLKEFHISASENEFFLTTEDGCFITTEAGNFITTEKNIYFQDKIDKTIHQLIQEAIDWWNDYLDKIDATVSASSNPKQRIVS